MSAVQGTNSAAIPSNYTNSATGAGNTSAPTAATTTTQAKPANPVDGVGASSTPGAPQQAQRGTMPVPPSTPTPTTPTTGGFGEATLDKATGQIKGLEEQIAKLDLNGPDGQKQMLLIQRRMQVLDEIIRLISTMWTNQHELIKMAIQNMRG